MGDRAVTIDAHSPTWRALAQRLARRIAALHADNESPVLNATDTAYLRGQIAALHEVLNLPHSVRKEPVAPDPYEGAAL